MITADMALKIPAKKRSDDDDDDVVDAPSGYAPRVVKTPMHEGADENPGTQSKKPNVKKAVDPKAQTQQLPVDWSANHAAKEWRQQLAQQRPPGGQPSMPQKPKKTPASTAQTTKIPVLKSISQTGESNMAKNEIADLFKSELGEDEQPLTTCVHCTEPLTKSDLHKGQKKAKKVSLTSKAGAKKLSSPAFVADDNTNPSERINVEAIRQKVISQEQEPVHGVLKACKEDEAPISKSEMIAMGMDVADLNDEIYVISKSEMERLDLETFIPMLFERKELAKSFTPKPNLSKGYTPRGPGVHDSHGNPLVQWVQGDDAEVAKYIEKSAGVGYCQGTDESIRTQGRGEN